MSGVQASQKAAADCIAKGDYKEALAHCKAALKADKSNYDTYILIGKAAFHLNEHQQSDLAYRKAIELDPVALPAWKGLAELAAATGNTHGTIEAYQQLLEHAPGDEPKRREWQGLLAEALSRVGRYEEAVQQYTSILQGLTDAPARLSLCCRLADIQIKLDEARAAAEMQARVEALAAGPPAGPDATSPTTSPRPKPGRIVSQRTVSNLQLEVLAAHALVDQQAAAGPLAGSSPPNKVGSPVRATVTSPVTSPRGPAPGPPQAPALRPDGRPCTWSTLVEVCNNTAPTPQYMCYHEELLKRCLLRIFAAPPRSVERQQHRLAALRECHAMIFNGRAGCTTPLPYEAAVWLLEEEEEIKGGHVSVGGQVVGGTSMAHVGAEGRIGCGQTAVVFALENFARRMVHQFPTDPTAQVCLGLMMRRRLAGTHPASLTQRRAIEKLLRRAMAGDSHADCASGWKGLAELQYENMDYQAAYDTAVRGLTWLQSRRERGHERLGQCALALRLVVAKALRRLGRLDEAEVHFKVLAGWVSEGETAFGDLSGSSPVSINQQALRGIAQIELERGDRCAAKAQYERILGKAALGHGPGEHWAHSDYGWLLYQDGDLQSARQQLEQAIVVAETPGAHITDVQMAQHRYRLGEVYWALKGRYRTDKQFAYKQFLEAAKIESHEQAAALAALGRYFEQVERRSDQAARVYKKALALDPTLATAGEGLTRLFIQGGKQDSATLLAEEITKRAPAATWGWKRLGFQHIQGNRYEEGIRVFQTALRGSVRDADAWEGLASCYQSLGRWTAALKAYSRALELDAGRLYSRVQCGSIRLTLGDYAEALKDFERALVLDGSHPAALLGAAETLASSARTSTRLGALGSAGDELAAAAAHVLRCTAKQGNLVAAWKLLGDVLLLHHAVDPAGGHALLGSGPSSSTPAAPVGSAAARTEAWGRRIRAVQLARRAYCKALRLDPPQGAAWSDLAATYYHESQLRRAHPAFSQPPGCREELLGRAEGAVRAGLRLAPASPQLWTALGTVAVEGATREYALSRGLQLDPKFTPAWLALARLYTAAGAPGLADRCLAQARSQDPTVAGVWEAMAALAELSPTGQKDAADFYTHSMGLGAGAEGMLGFAQAAITEGRGLEGAVYAAARKVAELQPLNPCALNTLGLAAEAREDYRGAARAYQAALQLLPLVGADPGAATRHASTAQAGTGAGSGSAAAVPLAAGVRLNLSRVLVKAGRCEEAVALFGEMEYSAELDGQPAGWLGYGVARLATGDRAGAAYALQQGLACAGDGEAMAELVRAWVQLHSAEGRPGQARDLLRQQSAALAQHHASLATLRGLWLAVVAGAGAAGDFSLAAQACLTARSWAGAADAETAEFFAELDALLAASWQVKGEYGEAAARLSKAVHTCPWEVHLSASLGEAAVRASLRHAQAAHRLLSLTAVEFTTRRKAPDDSAHSVWGKTPLQAALETQSVALLARCASAARQQAQHQLSALARAIHTHPTHAINWYLAALVATQAAAGSGGVRDDYRRAGGWCRAAVALAEARAPEQGGVRVQLGVCASECLLHSGDGPEAASQALSTAEAALDLASASRSAARGPAGPAAGRPDPADLAAAHCQVARCQWQQGDLLQAELAYRQALEAAQAAQPPLPHFPSVLGLAGLLAESGRLEEAVSLLQHAQQQLLGLASSDVAGWEELLLLRQAGMMSLLGELEGAKAAALAADDVAERRGQPMQGQGHLSKLLHGVICLQQAQQLTGPEGPGVAAVLGEARQALARAVGLHDSAVGRALLAQVESASQLRKKEERVAAHARQALHLAQRPVPSTLCSLLGDLTRSPTLHAKAVHAEPWREEAWARLGSSRAA